jgi:hypothetical protein
MYTAGYGYITNYNAHKETASGVQLAENRLWQQLLMKNNLGRVNFEHRYRLEQRWLKRASDSQLHRIRYLLRATVPLNKPKLEKNALFVTFYNEVFIHLTSQPFDRNRLYGALGFQITPVSNIQLGYMAQTSGNKTRQFLQAVFIYNLDFRKTES